MAGETDLGKLIASMQPVLDPETYVFVTCAADKVPPDLVPLMRFEEAEGTTLILTRGAARSASLDGVFASRRITLKIHSALEAVGFIAAVATRLAENGMGANPVSGFYHDHLFVAEEDADAAMTVLGDLAAGP